MSVGDPDLARAFHDALVLAGGSAPGSGPLSVSGGWRLPDVDQEDAKTMAELVTLDQGNGRKRFNPAVYSLDQESLAHVLKGLFTAEAQVGAEGDIRLASRSSELLTQVHLLLLGFGISSKLVHNPGSTGSALKIDPAFAARFREEIGLIEGTPRWEALARGRER